MKKTKTIAVIVLMILAVCIAISFPITKKIENSIAATKMYKTIVREMNDNENYSPEVYAIYQQLIAEYPESRAATLATEFFESYSEIFLQHIKVELDNINPTQDSAATIETMFKRLDECFPDTPASKEAQQYKPALVKLYAKLDEQDRQWEKMVKEAGEAAKKAEEAERKAFKQYLVKTGQSTDRWEYWYNTFSKAERAKIMDNTISIGDRDLIVLFLPGYYEKETSQSSYGTSNRYYGRSGTRYNYITSHEGIIDYISY